MGSMRKSRLSKYKQGRLVEHFVAGTAARTAASLCGVNRKTAALYFLRLREIIAYELEAESDELRPVFRTVCLLTLRGHFPSHIFESLFWRFVADA